MKDRAPIHAAGAAPQIVETHGNAGVHEPRADAETTPRAKKAAAPIAGLTFPRFFTDAGVTIATFCNACRRGVLCKQICG